MGAEAVRTRTAPADSDKANRPGSAAAGAAALPGAAQWDEPSTDGRPAGVSLSLDLTSPVVPEGSAGDAALSARSPVARPRSRHGAVTLPRTSPTHRSGTVRTSARRASWGGSPMLRPLPLRTTARRTGRPPEVARWHSSRAPAPLTPTTAEAAGPDRFPSEQPESWPHRLGSPAPVGVALSGTGHTLPHASPQVKTNFRIHRLLPRHSPLPPGILASSTVRAQDSHNAWRPTALPVDAGGPGPVEWRP